MPSNTRGYRVVVNRIQTAPKNLLWMTCERRLSVKSAFGVKEEAQFYVGVDSPSRMSLAASKAGERMARSQPK
jgi:hypothetical protein